MAGVRLWLVVISAVWLAACTREVVVLLPDEQGAAGAVVVEGEKDSLVLDQPLSSAKVSNLGRVKPTTVSTDDVQETFGAALDAQPLPPESFTLYFHEGSTRLTPQSRPTLEALLAEVESRGRGVDVQVTGHTDREGSVADNDQLSRRRAAEVRGRIEQVLRRQGLEGVPVSAVGRGEREPLIATADEVEEPRNRRVEVIVR